MPGTASCFTRMLGRKKLCSTSMLFKFTSVSSLTGTCRSFTSNKSSLVPSDAVFPSGGFAG